MANYGIIYYEGRITPEKRLSGPYLLSDFYEAANETEGANIGLQKLISAGSNAQIVKLFEVHKPKNAWLILEVKRIANKGSTLEDSELELIANKKNMLRKQKVKSN